MKTVAAILAIVLFSGFNLPTIELDANTTQAETTITVASFKLVNDTGKKSEHPHGKWFCESK